MPKGPEHQFRTKIRKKLHSSIYVWSIHDSFSAGTPDVWYSGSLADLWAEYKYYRRIPKKPIDLTAGKRPALSRLQQHWLNQQHELGRSVCVVVGFPDGAVILENKDWMLPFEPLEQMITVKELVEWIETRVNLPDKK